MREDTQQKAIIKLLLVIYITIFIITIIGIQYVNKYNQPSILLFSVISISFITFGFALPKTINKNIQILGIILISTSISFIIPLRGRIIARDAPIELHVMRNISEFGTWDLFYIQPVGPLLYNPYIVSIEKILAIDLIPTYSTYASFLTVPITLIAFIFFRQYFDGRIPFLLAVFTAFQHPMILSGLGSVRATTSILFFVLFLYTMTRKSTFLQIFALIAVIMNYYGSALLIVVFLLITYSFFKLLPQINQVDRSGMRLKFTIVILAGVISVGWLTYAGTLPHVVAHVERMIFSVEDLLSFGESGNSQSAESGPMITLPDLFNYTIIGGTFATMTLGSAIIFMKRTSDRPIVHSMLFSALFISAVVVVTPAFADATLSIVRVYRYTVYLLVLGLPVATIWITQKLPKSVIPFSTQQCGIIILAVIVALQFPVYTGMAYHIHGSGPEIIMFDDEGQQADIWKVEKAEVKQSEFLLTYGSNEYVIHGDRYSEHRVQPYLTHEWDRVNIWFFLGEHRRTKDGYVYLRHQNVVDKMIAPHGTAYRDLEPRETHTILNNTDKIYTNGGAELMFYESTEGDQN